MDRCQQCQFYERNPSGGAGGKAPGAGLCRRHAPSLSPISPKSYMIEGVWPTVREEDWCGEFKLAARRGDAPRADALIGVLAGAPAGTSVSTLPRIGVAAAGPASIGSALGGD